MLTWRTRVNFGGGVRLATQLTYLAEDGRDYYGIGNATTDVAPPGADIWYFAYRRSYASASAMMSFAPRPGGSFRIGAGASVVAERPSTYSGSLLESDAADPTLALTGAEASDRFVLAAGLLHDSRDDRISPTRGGRHELGMRAGLEFGDAYSYAGFTAQASGFASRPGASPILAARAFFDILSGDPPLSELALAGSIGRIEAPGGADGIRGINAGRFSGMAKAVVSLELRSRFHPWTIRTMNFGVGWVVFADAGRCWGTVPVDSTLDGEGEIHWGAGAGIHLMYGEGLRIRIETAFSPDAEDDQIALYLKLGSAF